MTRSILITGANRGLGLATARRLARAGHRLVLTGRDPAKAKAAVDGVRAEIPEAAVDPEVLDLCSLDSARGLAQRLLSAGRSFDVLVHNAGQLFPSPKRELTGDGVESCLQVHAVAPMLLTRLLLPALARPSRVYMLASSLHFPGSRGEEVDYRHDDPNLERRYHPQRAYKNSKLALLWVVYELDRRLGETGVHTDAVSPGFVPQTAAAGVHGRLSRFMMKRVMPRMPFARTLDDAADGLARLYGETPLDEPGGRYIRDWRPSPSSEQSRDQAQAERFWSWACAQAGLPDALTEPSDSGSA